MNITKIRNSVESFFLRPAYAQPLAAVRIGLAFVLLLQAYMLRLSLYDLFSHNGLVQGDLAEALTGTDAPRISWLVNAMSYLHFQESSSLFLAGIFYVVSLLFLLVGYHTRLFAFLAWLFHWMFAGTVATMAYGVDLYAHVFLFYLMFVPAGDAFSLDVLWGRRKNEPSAYARLGLRVMQLQLCITYLMSAKDKAAGIQWWNGEVMWRSLTGPLFQPFDMTWTSHWPTMLMLSGWLSLLLEAGYCIFIWPKRTRMIWVLGMVGLHAGIAIFLGLQLFGLIMCVLTPALFCFSPERKAVFEQAPQAWIPFLRKETVPNN
ncbi:MAG: hypothetical protein ACXVBE_12355 [Bdellovibrionota bacterium]